MSTANQVVKEGNDYSVSDLGNFTLSPTSRVAKPAPFVSPAERAAQLNQTNSAPPVSKSDIGSEMKVAGRISPTETLQLRRDFGAVSALSSTFQDVAGSMREAARSTGDVTTQVFPLPGISPAKVTARAA